MRLSRGASEQSTPEQKPQRKRLFLLHRFSTMKRHVSTNIDIWWQIVKQSAMMLTLILNWMPRLLNERKEQSGHNAQYGQSCETS